MIKISEETIKICNKFSNFLFDSGYDEEEHKRFDDFVRPDEYIPRFQDLFNASFMVSSMDMIWQRNRVFLERTGGYLKELICHRSVEKYIVISLPNTMTLNHGMCGSYVTKQVKKELDVLFPWCRKVVDPDYLSMEAFLKSSRTPFIGTYNIYMSLYRHLCGDPNGYPEVAFKDEFVKAMIDTIKK